MHIFYPEPALAVKFESIDFVRKLLCAKKPIVTLRVPADGFHSLTLYVSQNNLDMTVPLARLRRQASGTVISRFFG